MMTMMNNNYANEVDGHSCDWNNKISIIMFLINEVM